MEEEAGNMTVEELNMLEQKVIDLRNQGKYKETVENCYNCLQGGIELKNYRAIINAHLNLAKTFYYIGNISAAFNSLASHEEVYKKHGDKTDELNSYKMMFLLYEYNRNLEKSKIVLDNTIDLGEKLKDYITVIDAYSNYCNVYILEGDYKKALEMANKGLSIFDDYVPYDKLSNIKVKLNIANIYISNKNFSSSKVIIDEIINSESINLYVKEKAKCYDLQGNWYYYQNLYKEAFQSYSNAKDIIERYNDFNFLKHIQEKRCNLCEMMDNTKMGFKVQKEYITLLNEQNIRELDTLALNLEINRSIDSLEKRANTDYLTGVYNRFYIEKTTNEWLMNAYEKNESIVCILIDIDCFKRINDNYGHLFGDEVIKQVSRACSSILRKDDLFGRYGGDEFVIVMKGAVLENGTKKAHKILELIRDLVIKKDDKSVSVTISIGVADNITSKAKQFKEIFNIADIRLYHAKNRGRNQICIDV
ncbi:MAG: diguanylate cyclase [Bacillota bacterium]|nr:diguanylate cyclase [Bacillota bacterium]